MKKKYEVSYTTINMWAKDLAETMRLMELKIESKKPYKLQKGKC